MSVNLCGSCHKCCKNNKILIYQEDVDRWKKEGRYDIILCLERWAIFGVFLIHKKDKEECIFLDEEIGCTIHKTRPKICREFPRGWKHVKNYDCKIHPATKKRIEL
ncbi:YkgJ family cysteine cluster protein [Candidatus Woesearchaeota archaeon]|nr:YkgJ family cysteine cluster protein [Candidatus Woesearchaeota archaeon]